MKKIRMIFVVLITILVISFSCDPTSTEDPCDGMGTLSVKNTSLNTVQKLMIDGVNYGSLDPGAKKDSKLAPGTHSWQLVGISGGTGCSTASVIIVACKTSSYECSSK
jgi:hypothetical protein